MSLTKEESEILGRVADGYVIEMMFIRGDGNASEVASIAHFIEHYHNRSANSALRYSGRIDVKVYQYLKTRSMHRGDAIRVAVATTGKFETYEHAIEWLNSPLETLKGVAPVKELEYGYSAIPIVEALERLDSVLSPA